MLVSMAKFMINHFITAGAAGLRFQIIIKQQAQTMQNLQPFRCTFIHSLKWSILVE